jgi:hypothetical protein
MAGHGGNRARDAAIWDLYCNNWTQQALAARFSLSQQRVSQIIDSHRDALPKEEKADRVQRSLLQLDWIARELHALASAAPIPAYSNGRPIVVGEDPETGDPIIADDHSMRVTAMREMRATQESMRKMLGTDAKVETSLTVETSPEMAALVEQARARRAERQAPTGE